MRPLIKFKPKVEAPTEGDGGGEEENPLGILTEDSDPILTEDGDQLIQE